MLLVLILVALLCAAAHDGNNLELFMLRSELFRGAATSEVLVLAMGVVLSLQSGIRVREKGMRIV